MTTHHFLNPLFPLTCHLGGMLGWGEVGGQFPQEVGGGGGATFAFTDGDVRMGAKIKTPKNP